MIAITDSFLHRIDLLDFLFRSVRIYHASILCDKCKKWFGRHMMFWCGGLHEHIGSIRKLRSNDPSVFVREHLFHSILIKTFHLFQPPLITIGPLLVSGPLIYCCRWLSGEVIVIKCHDIGFTPCARLWPNAPVFNS